MTPPTHGRFAVAEDQLAREAAAWFVRINTREPDTEDVGEWQRWLLKSPAHCQAFSEIEDLWGTLGQTELSKVTTAIEPAVDASRSRRRSWAIGLAATLLLGAAGALFTFVTLQSNDLPASAVVKTRTAEDRTYLLPDGSRVQVGASTRIVVDFVGSTRNVIIDAGEAYFEVAHDKTRPFVVHAGGGTITAVGTAFNVHNALDRVSVAVVEGTVDVRAAGQDILAAHPDKTTGLEPPAPVLVHAGEGVAYDRLTRAIAPVDTRVATSWRDGHLKFLREPLAYVVSDIERYVDLQISIVDPSIAELLYTGSVTPDNLEEWLMLLPHAFPIEVQRISKTAILLKRRTVPAGSQDDPA